MILIAIQVNRSKVKVKGQAYSLYFGEGGITVLQTSIFSIYVQLLIHLKPMKVYVMF